MSEEVKEKNLIDEEISMDDLHAYKQQGFLARLPYWLKAVFLKYWFFGAIYFFVMMGLAELSGENAAILAGTISGCLFDIVVYNILIMMDSDLNESRHYMIFKSKKIWSIFINIVYQVALFILTMIICSSLLSLIEKEGQVTYFLREPFSVALVLSLLDATALFIKNIIVFLVNKNKKH